MKAHLYKVHMRITELTKTPNEKLVEEEQVADMNPVISSSGSVGLTRMETVLSCPFNLCSFTITKVRRLLCS